jgi:NAD(P)H dehydrogenase (quinone)
MAIDRSRAFEAVFTAKSPSVKRGRARPTAAYPIPISGSSRLDAAPIQSIHDIRDKPMTPSERRRQDGVPRIAIAGATGRVGAALLASLTADAVDVVALTRNPQSDRLPVGTEAAGVDFDDPATLVSALQGADRLFLSHGTSDRQVANEIAMIDAAVTAGVTHIVKLSAMGPPTRLHPFDWHMEIEAHLARKDVGYTVLRPSCYVDILTRAKVAVSVDDWGGTAEDGLVNMIDVRDIAAVARTALLDQRIPSAQRAYHLTGPAPVTMSDVADELSRLLGRTVVYRRRTVAEAKAALTRAGASDMVVGLLLGIEQIVREGVLAETTNTVLELTGVPARPITAWLKDNIAGFRSAPVTM